MKPVKSVLILDNDPKAARTLGRMLELYCQSFYIAAAYTNSSATYLACTGDFDIIILDLSLGEDDGVRVAKAVHSRCIGNAPKLIAVSSDQNRVAAERTALLFTHALHRPLIVERLFEAVRGA